MKKALALKSNLTKPKPVSKPNPAPKAKPNPVPVLEPESLTQTQTLDLVSALSQWFTLHHRQLPWRLPLLNSDTVSPRSNQRSASQPSAYQRSPYATWISEIMLQQTQVVTVVDYFQRWMKLFPDIDSLAAASEGDVLAAWAGLGYYSRARNLLASAKKVATEFGGVFPSRREELMALKGVGEYTAGAIASLAFNRPEPILDGNVVRVFSRLYGLAYLPISKTEKASYWSLSKTWVDAGIPSLVNEGLMELGALICTPKAPNCECCPLKSFCWAFGQGEQARFPPPKARKEVKEIAGLVVVASRRDSKTGNTEILLYRPEGSELLAGLWTFPIFETTTLSALKVAWSKRLPDFKMPAFRLLPTVISHSITHHRIRLRLVLGQVTGEADSLPRARKKKEASARVFQWLITQKLERELVSSLPRKIWKAMQKASAV